MRDPTPSITKPEAPAAGLPLLLTFRDACCALALGRRKLWELTNTGELPCVRIGRAVRYDPRDLIAFIEKRRSGGDR